MNLSSETKNEFAVSVIIPTYNSGAYLAEAVNSVLRQTKPAQEIIVVDDGSTDHTKAILQSFIDQKQVDYIRQENSGPAAARNRGIKLAKSDFIAFLDADDVWLENKLELELPFFDDPEVGLVYGQRLEFEDSAKLERKMNTPLYSGKIFPQLIKNNFITNSSVVVRKDIFRQIDLFNEDQSLRAIEDYELWLRVAAHFKIVGVDQLVVKYRIHPAQISYQIVNRNILLKLSICRRLWFDIYARGYRTAILLEWMKNYLRLIKSKI
ncbi:MAG: glycosyltransferase [bacterium]